MVIDLLNTVQASSAQINAQAIEIQQLKDEINRLKGEHIRPKFKADKQPAQPKKGTEAPKSGGAKQTGESKKAKKDRVKIDRIVSISVDRSILPDDAVFKGFKRYVQQNVRLVRDNVEYVCEVFYSPSMNRTYKAEMGEDYRGKFGYEIVGLTQYFNNVCDVTKGRLAAMYESLGVVISGGTLTNMLIKEGKWVIKERDDILRAGLEQGPVKQIDATKTIESGRGLNTQIICGKYFKTFFSRSGRTRLDVISVLQGMSGKETKLCYNKIARYFMHKLKVTHHDQRIAAQYLKEGQILDTPQMWALLEQNKNLAGAKAARRSKLNDALALAHYYTQQDYTVVDFLLSDDAKEYKMIARRGHALCWLHDIRFFRKMVPRSAYHKDLLAKFIDQYWQYYDRLKKYRKVSPARQKTMKAGLVKQFDKLFNTTSDYAELQAKMERTYANKDQLLTFLDHPCIPLHNNSSERGARRIVRKRDVSLHTTSEQGTVIKDSFLSTVETARKLGVNTLDYINQRIRGQKIEQTLAQLVKVSYSADALAF